MTRPLMTLRRVGVSSVAAVLAFAVLAACSPAYKSEKGSTGATILHWYVGPDRLDSVTLAKACSSASDGDYELRVEKLPPDADQRHSALVRRLSAKDPTIDLIGLDDSFTAEFAKAQFLAPVPDDLAPAYAKDVFPKALAAATFDGALVAAPWWFDPQLLWYRGNVGERAGLDMSKPVVWDELIAGAARVGAGLEIDDANGRGVPDLVSALVNAAGGKVVDGTGRQSPVGLQSEAGEKAASILQLYDGAEIGPGPSVDALEEFAGTSGGFLLAPTSVVSDPTLAAVAADLQWAPYPVVDADSPSVAPLAGVALAVPLYAPHTDLSYKAINCLTTASSMEALMSSAGHSSSRMTTYDDVKSSYPMAAVARKAMTSGASVPKTPYWQAVRAGILDTWLPLGAVEAQTTPSASQKAVTARLAGELP
ncbi:extracellular solute-binding protein [Aeromicrobium sp.]